MREWKMQCVEQQAQSLPLSLNPKSMLGLNFFWDSHPCYLPKLCCSCDHAWPWAMSPPPIHGLSHPVTTSPGHCPPCPHQDQPWPWPCSTHWDTGGLRPSEDGIIVLRILELPICINICLFIYFEASLICLYSGQIGALQSVFYHVGLMYQIPCMKSS